MKSFTLIATASIVLAATAGVTNAACSCEPTNYDCLSKCVDTTHNCLSSCNDTECYSSCIGNNWPGAKPEENSVTASPTASEATAIASNSVDVSATNTPSVSDSISASASSASDSISASSTASASLESSASISSATYSFSSFSSYSYPSASILPSSSTSSLAPHPSQHAPNACVTTTAPKEFLAVAVTIALLAVGGVFQ